MKDRKTGSRHLLLFYRRSLDRIWKSTLILGMILLAAVRWDLLNQYDLFGISSDVWFLATAYFSLFVCLVTFLERYFTYVQVHSGFLSVVTPFLRFKISFRRIRSMHPALIQQLFPKVKANWTQRSFLDPFYGKTALVLELAGYPLNPMLLRLFLPNVMFSPHSEGLVLMVPDWMKLSTELDSLKGAWPQMQTNRSK